MDDHRPRRGDYVNDTDTLRTVCHVLGFAALMVTFMVVIVVVTQ